MDAVEFIKERDRMCKCNYNMDKHNCEGCKAFVKPKGNNFGYCKALVGIIRETNLKEAADAVSIVEKWSKDHPEDTTFGKELCKLVLESFRNETYKSDQSSSNKKNILIVTKSGRKFKFNTDMHKAYFTEGWLIIKGGYDFSVAVFAINRDEVLYVNCDYTE